MASFNLWIRCFYLNNIKEVFLREVAPSGQPLFVEKDAKGSASSGMVTIAGGGGGPGGGQYCLMQTNDNGYNQWKI
ncbi:MAG TPA: hypothetical protein PK191_07450 [Niabella sp.]|nr:hypothetical protein [Niabella sp.]HOZ97590.1 hypothetical protein [Niabella sp.]HQW15728.1 hypothetical protein [Niabella sp.]HQX21003.1 hypothetical protein [Niabella sp.]HQX42212.1 hypothetical protein [Niabella sp.]